MTPQEIAQLKTQSHTLREALKGEPKLWHFLREGVKLLPSGICQQCRVVEVDTLSLLQVPYGPHGWCLDCVLAIFQNAGYNEVEYYSPYRDPKSPKYDAEYAKSCDWWDDFHVNLDGVEWA